MRFRKMKLLNCRKRVSFKKAHAERLKHQSQLKAMLIKARLKKGVGSRIGFHWVLGPGIYYPDKSFLLLPLKETHGTPRDCRNGPRHPCKPSKPLYPLLTMWQGVRLVLLGSRRPATSRRPHRPRR